MTLIKNKYIILKFQLIRYKCINIPWIKKAVLYLLFELKNIHNIINANISNNINNNVQEKKAKNNNNILRIK